jgi:hypothetical protein
VQLIFISFIFGSQATAVERQEFKHKFLALNQTAEYYGGFFIPLDFIKIVELE